ncbi:site-2 protease family protein [Nocardioides montaniterrae]
MLKIGTIAGSPVLVSPSWFLIAGLIAWFMGPVVEETQPGLGAWKYAVGVVFAIALYGAVLLHEASHALVARRFGYRVEAITLHFLGGATTIDRESENARQEFWIAVVGPITSLLVGGAAIGLVLVVPDGLSRLVLEGLAVSNLYIGVLNLVPALPLDGGRVLKSAVWAASGRASQGALVAGWAGRILALGIVAVALVLAQLSRVSSIDMIIWMLMAAFLWTGASQAIAGARLNDRLAGVDIRSLARRTLGVPEDLPLGEAVRRAQEAAAGSIVTISGSGVPMGIVDERAVLATPQDRRPWVAVSTVTRRIESGLTLPAGISGTALLAALRNTPATEYLLLEDDGSICGVLATADVARHLR